MTWQADIARLPDDRSRVEYLSEELLRRDAEADALAMQFRCTFGLSPAEARIAARLMRSLGQVVPYEILIDAMNPADDTENPRRTLSVHVHRIRQKLRVDPLKIVTVHGDGLMMNGPDDMFGPNLSASGSEAPTAPDAGTNERKQND